MDAFAKGLKVAYKLLEDRVLENFIEERYSSFREGLGKQIVEGKVTLQDLEEYALKQGPIRNKSGRQELLEMIVNQYILEV